MHEKLGMEPFPRILARSPLIFLSLWHTFLSSPTSQAASRGCYYQPNPLWEPSISEMAANNKKSSSIHSDTHAHRKVPRLNDRPNKSAPVILKLLSRL